MEPNLEKILETEYSLKFDEIRKKMMVTSYFKYGPMKENYETFKCINCIESLQKKLSMYQETGNIEYLCDVANYAMIEYMYPSIEGAYYKPTDGTSNDIVGFGVNQIKDEYKEMNRL